MASTEGQKAKDRGNAEFKAGNFPEAIGHYTAAILADRKDPTYPLNRAAAYLKLGKYEDAERDCSTVLDLKHDHVKALYRRAQARIELANLPAAHKDLIEALRLEPSNDSVKLELKRISELSQRPKAPSKLSINAKLPKRRRVPIEVVEPLHSASASPLPSLLEPISTRTLSSKDTEILSKPSAPAALDSSQSGPSFTEEAFAAGNPGSGNASKPTMQVRGGIFRPSGEHTIFRPPDSTTSVPSTRVKGSSTGPQKDFSSKVEVYHHSPISLFEFTRSWEFASLPERWDLICKITPLSFPSFFKTSLEAPLLLSIIEVFSLAVISSGDPTIRNRIREYLNSFPKVPRFNTVTMFMTKEEKNLCKVLIDSVADVNGWRL